MKKYILIFSALLSVFVLNSCKDNETINNGTSNNSVITIAELKSYTGKTPEQVASIIKSKGFTYQLSGETEDDGLVFPYYCYKSNDNLSKIIFLEYNNKVSVAGATYGESSNRETGINQFVSWSSECALFANNITIDRYNSHIDDNSYETHSNFLAAFNQLKDNLNECQESFTKYDDFGFWISFYNNTADYPFEMYNYFAEIFYEDYSLPHPDKSLKLKSILSIK